MGALTRILLAVAGLTITVAGGCRAKPSVSALISDNEERRLKALSRLLDLSDHQASPYIPPLIAKLTDPDPRVVERAVDALAVAGEPTLFALQAEIGKSDDIFLRIAAAEIAGKLGNQGKPAIPWLLPLLSHPHPLVRDQAAEALGDIGDSTLPILTALAQAAQDDNADVRAEANMALKKLSGARQLSSRRPS